MKNKLFTLLGFAQKSGNLITGENTCELYLKKKEVYLLIVSEDAAENTIKKMTGHSQKYGVPLYQYGGREELSISIGKANRAVIGITNRGFAKKMAQLLNQMDIKVLERAGGEAFVKD